MKNRRTYLSLFHVHYLSFSLTKSPNAFGLFPAARSYQLFHLLSAYNVEELEAVENLPINRTDPFHAEWREGMRGEGSQSAKWRGRFGCFGARANPPLTRPRFPPLPPHHLLPSVSWMHLIPPINWTALSVFGEWWRKWDSY